MTMSDERANAGVAFLFSCPEEGLLAVTCDRTGRNIPGGGWQFERELLLGVHEVLPVPIDPEPLLRGIDAEGHFIWKIGSRNPSGTSQ
jgi:hypothetical protein